MVNEGTSVNREQELLTTDNNPEYKTDVTSFLFVNSILPTSVFLAFVESYYISMYLYHLIYMHRGRKGWKYYDLLKVEKQILHSMQILDGIKIKMYNQNW